MHDCSIFFFVLIVFYSLTTFTLVKYSSTKIFLGGRLYKENNQKNCTIIHILFFYACLILNTFQVMLAVFIFLVVLLLMTIFFQDFSRSEFRRMLLFYDGICFCLFAPSVSVSVSVRVSVISSPASIVSTAVVSTIIAGTSIVSIPGISSSVGLRVSLGVSLTLLAFCLFFSRGNYGKSIAVKASVGITINTCVRVDHLRGSQGRAGGKDSRVSFGITLASVVSVSVRVSVVSTVVSVTISVSAISVSTAIVSVPSISCGISLSLRGGLRLGKCQTGQ